MKQIDIDLPEEMSRKQEDKNKYFEQGYGNGEPLGVILSRSCSLTSAASLRVRTEKQNSQLEETVKRAFSQKKSPSFPEAHDGIFHQFNPVEENGVKARRNKNKRRNFLKACKRLLWF